MSEGGGAGETDLEPSGGCADHPGCAASWMRRRDPSLLSSLRVSRASCGGELSDQAVGARLGSAQRRGDAAPASRISHLSRTPSEGVPCPANDIRINKISHQAAPRCSSKGVYDFVTSPRLLRPSRAFRTRRPARRAIRSRARRQEHVALQDDHRKARRLAWQLAAPSAQERRKKCPAAI